MPRTRQTGHTSKDRPGHLEIRLEGLDQLDELVLPQEISLLHKHCGDLLQRLLNRNLPGESE